MEKVKFTGSKMARLKAMAAVGIMTAGIMMGAMSNDAHAANYNSVSISNSTISGDVMIGGQQYGDNFRDNLNIHNPNSEYYDANYDTNYNQVYEDPDFNKMLKNAEKLKGKVKIIKNDGSDRQRW